MTEGYRFHNLPAYAAVHVDHRGQNTSPSDIYELAVAFRDVYERAKSLSQKVSVAEGSPLSVDEWRLLYAVPQALIVQLALSNELLLKAILLGSKDVLVHGHSLKGLMSELDVRYVDYIKKYLMANGLKPASWDLVMEASDKIFVTARYGYEQGSYKVDFMTLQLLNESLDDIYHNLLPNWYAVLRIKEEDTTDFQEAMKNQIDQIFDPDYQRQVEKELAEWQKLFDDDNSNA